VELSIYGTEYTLLLLRRIDRLNLVKFSMHFSYFVQIFVEAEDSLHLVSIRKDLLKNTMFSLTCYKTWKKSMN
jgi:hypothetical protein